MLNSTVMFEFSFEQRISFWVNLVNKAKIVIKIKLGAYTNSNGLNSMVMF